MTGGTTASDHPSKLKGYRHQLPADYRVTSTAVLGGLHHEYGLEKEAASRGIEFLRTTGLKRDMFRSAA
jgi:hypothetical protein